MTLATYSSFKIYACTFIIFIFGWGCPSLWIATGSAIFLCRCFTYRAVETFLRFRVLAPMKMFGFALFTIGWARRSWSRGTGRGFPAWCFWCSLCWWDSRDGWSNCCLFLIFVQRGALPFCSSNCVFRYLVWWRAVCSRICDDMYEGIGQDVVLVHRLNYR